MIRKKVLFLNKHIINIVLISFATILGAVLGFINQLILSKIFDINQFGLFMSSYSLIMLLTPLSLFGIPTLWLKLFGENGANAIKWIGPSISAVSLLSFILMGFIIIWGFTNSDSLIELKTFIFFSFLIPLTAYSNLVKTKNQLEEKFIMFSINNLLPSLSRFLLLGILFFANQHVSPSEVAFYYVLCALLVLLSMAKELVELKNNIIRTKIGSVHKFYHKAKVSIKNVLAETFSYGYSGVLYLSWTQGHIFITKYKFDNINAGLYAVAILMITALTIVPTTIFSKYFTPKIHYYFFHDKNTLKLYYNKVSLILISAGVLVGLSLYFLADSIINLLYSSEYLPAISLLKIFALSLPLKFLGLNPGTLLTTGNFIKHKNKILTLAVFFNLTATIIMPEKYGINGMAFLVLVTETVLFGYYFFYTKNIYFKN